MKNVQPTIGNISSSTNFKRVTPEHGSSSGVLSGSMRTDHVRVPSTPFQSPYVSENQLGSSGISNSCTCKMTFFLSPGKRITNLCALMRIFNFLHSVDNGRAQCRK